MPAKKQGMLKDGSRRRPTGREGRGGGMPRIMWLAILVCVAGAVFLFRTQTGSVPTGIGENQTVVTAPEVVSPVEQEQPPRSGDVDIAAETRDLTPEKPQGEAATEAARPAPARPEPAKPAATSPATTSPATTKSDPAKPAPPPIRPAASGPYVVQIGSFGQAENADQEAARLAALGWEALVKVGNTSDGAIIYRVRIGYFASRSQAETFIKQNRSHMAGAIAVHR